GRRFGGDLRGATASGTRRSPRRTRRARAHGGGKRSLVRRALAIAALGLIALGCTVGPNYRRPESTVPDEFRGLGPENPGGPMSIADLPWWEVFGDPVLHGLIQEALQQNYDLLVAAQRILDARAQGTIARSFQFPELNPARSAPY